MMENPVLLALLALLLPAGAFLFIGVLAPLRRSGRPAAFLSIAAVATSLGAAIRTWQLAAASAEPIRAVWNWLPGVNGPLATMGVLIDHQSSVMLILVTLVATLVQIYSLEYLHDEPPAAFGRYYAYHSLFVFSIVGGLLSPNLLKLFPCRIQVPCASSVRT